MIRLMSSRSFTSGYDFNIQSSADMSSSRMSCKCCHTTHCSCYILSQLTTSRMLSHTMNLVKYYPATLDSLITNHMSKEACPHGTVGLNNTIDHSACWADGLMALVGLGSTRSERGFFSSIRLADML